MSAVEVTVLNHDVADRLENDAIVIWFFKPFGADSGREHRQ